MRNVIQNPWARTATFSQVGTFIFAENTWYSLAMMCSSKRRYTAIKTQSAGLLSGATKGKSASAAA
jgi:hypothetical protein